MRARPAVRAYMMSLISVRKLQLGDQFATKFPHSWLVWEPGVWQPAKGASSPTRIGGVAGVNDRPSHGDALCFELAEPRAIRIGRAPDCDVVLNDATVSREHVILDPAGPGRWIVKPAGPTTSAMVGELPLSMPVELRVGMKLKLGDVTLTFHDAYDFGARLDLAIREAKK